jgi:endonuclease-3
MNRAAIENFFSTLRQANPLPVTELQYTTVFELLAAVLLSAQATDVGVNKATRRLFPVANTPAKILALGLEGLESYIKTIGLYRSKARHLMQTCQILIEQHGGQVPRDRQALQALPGVGRKTANVVLNSAYGEAVMPVDTHIFRVSNRTGLAPGKNVDAVEAALRHAGQHRLVEHRMARRGVFEHAFTPVAQFALFFLLAAARVVRDVIHHAAEGVKADHVPLSLRRQAGQRKGEVRLRTARDLFGRKRGAAHGAGDLSSGDEDGKPWRSMARRAARHSQPCSMASANARSTPATPRQRPVSAVSARPMSAV